MGWQASRRPEGNPPSSACQPPPLSHAASALMGGDRTGGDHCGRQSWTVGPPAAGPSCHGSRAGAHTPSQVGASPGPWHVLEFLGAECLLG